MQPISFDRRSIDQFVIEVAALISQQLMGNTERRNDIEEKFGHGLSVVEGSGASNDEFREVIGQDKDVTVEIRRWLTSGTPKIQTDQIEDTSRRRN